MWRLRYIWKWIRSKLSPYWVIDMEKLEVGDIILEHVDGIVGFVVRKFTKSAYAHAALYIGNGRVIESTSPYVYSRNIQRLIYKKKHHVKILRERCGLDAYAQELIVRKACSYTGATYSKVGALATVLGNIGRIICSVRDNYFPNLSGWMFCSRMVADIYQQVEDIMITESVEFCKPSDIEKSVDFTEVKGAVFTPSSSYLKMISRPDLVRKNHRRFSVWFAFARFVAGCYNFKIKQYSDVYNFLRRYQRFDGVLEKVIRITGYHRTFKDDLKVNPARYDATILSKALPEENMRARFVLGDAKVLLSSIDWNLQELFSYWDLMRDVQLRYLILHVELYSKFLAQQAKALDCYIDTVMKFSPQKRSNFNFLLPMLSDRKERIGRIINFK